MRKAESRPPKRGANIIQEDGAEVIIRDHKIGPIRKSVKPWHEVTVLSQKKQKGTKRGSQYGGPGIHSGMTYKELQEVLTQLGFVPIETTGTHKAYKEKAGEAVIVLPEYKDTDQIRPFHLAGVKRLLIERGIVSETNAQE